MKKLLTKLIEYLKDLSATAKATKSARGTEHWLCPEILSHDDLCVWLIVITDEMKRLCLMLQCRLFGHDTFYWDEEKTISDCWRCGYGESFSYVGLPESAPPPPKKLHLIYGSTDPLPPGTLVVNMEGDSYKEAFEAACKAMPPVTNESWQKFLDDIETLPDDAPKIQSL